MFSNPSAAQLPEVPRGPYNTPQRIYEEVVDIYRALSQLDEEQNWAHYGLPSTRQQLGVATPYFLAAELEIEAAETILPSTLVHVGLDSNALYKAWVARSTDPSRWANAVCFSGAIAGELSTIKLQRGLIPALGITPGVSYFLNGVGGYTTTPSLSDVIIQPVGIGAATDRLFFEYHIPQYL